MDINQQHKIQCFNCHADIMPNNTEKETGPTCEECLNAHSSQISSLQTQNQVLQQILNNIEGDLDAQLNQYRGKQDQELTVQQLQKQLSQLEEEQRLLLHQDQKMKEEMHRLEQQFQQTYDRLDKQSSLLCAQEVALSNFVKKSKAQEAQLEQLELKKIQLERMPILSELYNIYFDNDAAYINQQPLSHQNCNILAQILCHIAEMCDYKDFKVDFASNCIFGENTLIMQMSTPERTIPWLSYLASKVVAVSEHMKSQTAEGPLSKENFSLPYKMTVEAEVAIGGVPLRQGPSYPTFLKLLTHELKFMMNYAFMKLRKT